VIPCQRCSRAAGRLGELPGIAEVNVAKDTAFLGGGSIPTQGFETIVVRVRFRELSETDVATRLRLGNPAVVPRVQEGHVIFDLRTIFPSQEDSLIQAVAAACGQ
jgi:L-seryl-tRNA(Ser) seleniumtransferase